MSKMNKTILHIEGFAVLALSLALYAKMGFGWLTFAVLFLLPDLSFIGYAFGPKAGAIVYNLLHTYLFPIILLAFGFLVGHMLSLQLALIWTAHIGMDRMLGYGLKYPTSFHHTHMHRM